MEELPYLKTIVKGAGLVLIGTIISKFLSFVYRIFIARYFGVEEYGIFSMALALLSFFMIIVLLGLPQGITRYVSYYKSKGSEAKVKGTILDSFKLSLIVSVILAFLLFLISDTIAFYLFHDTTGKITTLIRIMSLSLPFFSLFMLSTSASVGFKKIEHRVYTEYISQNLLKLVFTVFFGLIGLGVFGIGLAWTLAIILTSFLSLYLLNKTFPLIKKTIKSHPMKKELLHFSMPLLFAGFLGTIVSYTDTVMLGFFTTPKEVGIYNAALPIAQLLMVPSALLSSLLLPVLSEMYAKKKTLAIKKIYKTITRWSFYLSFPLLVTILFFSQQILIVTFGEIYIKGSTALIILSMGFFLNFTLIHVVNVMSLMKKTTKVLHLSIVAAFTNFLLNLFLIPVWNIEGAATASFTSYLIIFILSLIWINKNLHMFPLEFAYVKSILAGCFAGFSIFFIKDIFYLNFFFAIVLSLLLLIIYVFILLFFKSFLKEDIEIILSIEKRTGINLERIKKLLRKII
ncbi:MAG: hypothetical protein DRP13_01050 [Candidatus Aenigmatarchaeota archaeon]|nr:MAG: hypothetical protein DRP13_01050 [Candidatus Aenigmarchaeota archaeon]